MALEDEQATGRLMADIAGLIEPGDLITLSGDLGAGKTAFARAFIRHIAGDETIEVPSPTFTLMQTYDLPRFPVVHADLYRLGGPSETRRTRLRRRAGDRRHAAGMAGPRRRPVAARPARHRAALCRRRRARPSATPQITGYGAFAARAERIAAIRRFLNDTGFGQATRRRIQGDASTRSYERLLRDGTSYILMNSPRRPDGPRGARRQALQRDRASGRDGDAVHRHGARPAHARLFGAGDLSPPTATPDCWCWKISAMSWSSKAIRRRRSRSATRSPPICWRRCIASARRTR